MLLFEANSTGLRLAFCAIAKCYIVCPVTASFRLSLFQEVNVWLLILQDDLALGLPSNLLKVIFTLIEAGTLLCIQERHIMKGR